ncbi:rhodanese-like domain-containing protein [Paraburkholderia dilworthii]|uniref:rhodanese-like domain-containing protein n=1 Tax=Paraburkholderia dilworthii TaxID=948106 RepID=UPI00041949ED|nr:rhodanese-like domain-containing protein [Paraburkholderia dilworthii]
MSELNSISAVNTINAVTAVPAAPSAAAIAHFQTSFEFETDCADVFAALQSGTPGFVLLDVRSPALFAAGHVPGAIGLPHGKIVASRLAVFPDNTLFVTYCAGPHCNGAARGALRLAQLGRPVKLMAGGVTGWIDEGYTLTPSAGVAKAGASEVEDGPHR